MICQDLDMCVDILLRHGAESFDYDVLSQDFQRFDGQGLSRLMLMVSNGADYPKAARRAQDILSRSNWQFPPAARQDIARLWPSADPQRHMQIMAKLGGPLMRDRAIATLNHPDGKVASLSRELLKRLASTSEQSGKAISKRDVLDLPLAPDAFEPLTRAAQAAPTPEIIRLIGTAPAPQAAPVLRGLLQSEAVDVITAAYAQLYAYSPNMALSEFKTAIKTLKTPAQVLAVSGMLQRRHMARARTDKSPFYLALAHNLAADANLPAPARMAGLDAVMNSAGLAGKTLPKRADIMRIFEMHVRQTGASFLGYAGGFEKNAGENTPQFLSLVWDETLRRAGTTKLGPNDMLALMETAQRIARNPDWRAEALLVLRQGLNINKDWRVQKSAALSLGQIGDKTSQSQLMRLSQTHPILDVRAAAGAALSAGENKQVDFQAVLKTLSRDVTYCAVQNYDFKDDAKQLPFFESGRLPVAGGTSIAAERQYLSSAFPTQDGWLAGYRADAEGGGLLYYNNAAGDHQFISRGNIMAVLPTSPTPLGTFATEFWFITQADNLANISSLRLMDNGPKITPHMILPARPSAMNILPDQSLHFGFGRDAHPPLRLLPNGQLVSGCTKINPKPQSGSRQSLPN